MAVHESRALLPTITVRAFVRCRTTMQIEVPVCGRIVNKYDQVADGRTIILKGCLMLPSQ
jgi:hypothetical protein